MKMKSFIEFLSPCRVLSLSYVFLATMALVVFSGDLRAQGVGGTRGLPGSSDGVHTIQGRVYSPTGKPVSTPLKVRLESPNTSSLQTVTDHDGAFTFPRLQAGDYRVIIEGGTEFETANETASIYRESSPGGRIVRVDIFMRPKENFGSVHKDAVDAYKKAQEFDRAGDSKKAIESLNKALAVYPKFGAALNLLGVQYLKMGQADKAAETLDAAVKAAPDEFLPRLNYGIALLNQKKFDLAEQELKAALAKNAASPTGHMYLGIALMNQKRLDEAEKELRVAADSNSNEIAPAHRYLGGIYWGMRDYKRAAEELETYLKLMPNAADAERTRAAIKDLRSKQ